MLLHSFKKRTKAFFSKSKPSSLQHSPTQDTESQTSTTSSSTSNSNLTMGDDTMQSTSLSELQSEAPPESQSDCPIQSNQDTARDPYTNTYVPFVDNTALKSNLFASPLSTYGRVNPSIMQGFGGDDESIWLVDDEESDEESQKKTKSSSCHLDSSRVADAGPSSGTKRSEPAMPSAFSYRFNPNLLSGYDSDIDSDIDGGSDQPHQQKLPSPVVARYYAPISDSILSGFDTSSDSSSPRIRATSSRPKTPEMQSQDTPWHPYVTQLVQHDQNMTLSHLRHLQGSGMLEDKVADDSSFGQRYHRSTETSGVVILNKRVPVNNLKRDLDCVICTDQKQVEEFPQFSITASCGHAPNACLNCIQVCIESDLQNRLWTDIRCPECRESLEYIDIQRYSNRQTFLRYESFAIRAAMSQADSFIWCTSGCGSGQIHASGTEQPIVTCLHCGHRSCFQHNVAWHETLTCEDYDRLLADPINFRPHLENDDELRLKAQKEESRLLEERQRQERRQAKKATEMMKQIAARRKKEEEQSEKTIHRTTKPCPGCAWAIEKNDGCSHMTCIKCHFQFCWACLERWKHGHTSNCVRAPGS